MNLVVTILVLIKACATLFAGTWAEPEKESVLLHESSPPIDKLTSALRIFFVTPAPKENDLEFVSEYEYEKVWADLLFLLL